MRSTKKEQMQKIHEEYLDISVRISEHEIAIREYELSIKAKEVSIAKLRAGQDVLMRRRMAVEYHGSENEKGKAKVRK